MVFQTKGTKHVNGRQKKGCWVTSVASLYDKIHYTN
jgi:hypothetical protein